MKKYAFLQWIFIGMILLLSSACSFNGSSYKASSEEVLSTVLADEYLVAPEEAKALGADPSYLFIDLRSPSEFTRGHVDHAINIPTQNLLEPASRSRLRDKTKTFILYGATELAANGPWMLLRQLGYGNIKVLQGGYAYWSDLEADGDYLTETAQYPYDSLFLLATQRTRMEEEALRARAALVKQSSAPQKAIVPQKKKVEKEEEEGC